MTSEQPTVPEQPGLATVSVYQNSDHVAGILQQMANRGLLTFEDEESTRGDTNRQQTSGGGKADAGAGISVPVIGKVTGKIGGNMEHQRGSDSSKSMMLKKRFEYSAAYHLHFVRKLLRETGQVSALSSRADATALKAGDFVEYQAKFRADEASAILDIATPELVSSITRYVERIKTVKGFADPSDFDAMQLYIAKRKFEEDAKAEVAFAVAKALRVDFRSDATRQYYGEVSSGEESLHAITICESQHFIVEDEDRLLDGVFTVLGKVVDPVQTDTPILERNKLLHRINPVILERGFRSFEEITDSTATARLAGKNDNEEDVNFFDTKLRARLEGPAIKVLPIAIYV